MSLKSACETLGISRSGQYRKKRQRRSLDKDEGVVEKLKELRLLHPFWGYRRMTAWLRTQGYEVNPKRVRRLLRRMGLQAIYPHKRGSFSSHGHKIYPYLLEGVKVERPDQVWGADITYIRLAHGFVYIVAVMDWFSRYIFSWELSNTLDSRFCAEALRKAPLDLRA